MDLALDNDKRIVDLLHGTYRRVASGGYDLPISLVNIWVGSGPDFHQLYDVESDEGANALVHWWLASGRRDYPKIAEIIDQDLVAALHTSHLSEPVGAPQPQLTPLLRIIWHNRPDLQAHANIETADGVAGLWKWWNANGTKEYLSGAGPAPATVLVSLATHAPQSTSLAAVGHPSGEFGLGEDIRQLRAAFRAIDEDLTVIVAPWKITARQAAQETFTERDLSVFDRDVVFYAMPAFDTLTLLSKAGPEAFRGRRKIGFWQWELETFPDQAQQAFDLVDEIWCHSEHAAKAFRRATSKPVYKVPLPVAVPPPARVPRSRFGLGDDAFVFFTSFDGASSIARKNPLGAILAFQRAYPHRSSNGPNVNLVVKAMNTGNDSLWRECLRRAAYDDRIKVFDEVLDHHNYYELLHSCDAVVSLHRAEGFGRLMAEAMALKMPVIASRYSGNLDFMNDHNSWLIGGDMIPVLPGDYHFHRGQHWIEPDLDEAVRAFQECVSDGAKRQRLAAAGKLDITAKYNPDVCGAAYRDILQTSATRRTTP